MRGLVFIGVAAGLGALAFGLPETGGDWTPQAAMVDPMQVGSVEPGFVARAGAQSCAIRQAGTSKLAPAGDCSAVSPVLAQARAWRAEADMMQLLDAEGHTLMEFAAADGEGYETFRPGVPPVSLYRR